MDGYIVAGPPSTFRFQPNDSRTVRFPAIFALRVDLVRSVRVGAQDSLLRRTHESASEDIITYSRAPPALNSLCAAQSLLDLPLGRVCLIRADATPLVHPC